MSRGIWSCGAGSASGMWSRPRRSVPVTEAAAHKRSSFMSRLQRILHPTDFSRASRAGFARAVSMAKDDRAELLLVHVLAPPLPMAGDGYNDIEVAAEKYGQKHLGALSGQGPQGWRAGQD